ncbi:hypothetical protein [Microbacterium sp. BF1]|uniref:hypothetical protein n=1 Tax=Microbacterium sp. BF1 TaxID=2821146 RepID=UPI001C4DEBD6|nr:hypothetical protein [Microbacterium sp. BF1]
MRALVEQGQEREHGDEDHEAGQRYRRGERAAQLSHLQDRRHESEAEQHGDGGTDRPARERNDQMVHAAEQGRRSKRRDLQGERGPIVPAARWQLRGSVEESARAEAKHQTEKVLPRLGGGEAHVQNVKRGLAVQRRQHVDDRARDPRRRHAVQHHDPCRFVDPLLEGDAGGQERTRVGGERRCGLRRSSTQETSRRHRQVPLSWVPRAKS